MTKLRQCQDLLRRTVMHPGNNVLCFFALQGMTETTLFLRLSASTFPVIVEAASN
jgi:hypothetical protein